MRAEPGDLEDKDAVVVEEVIDLAKEGLVAADTDVLHGRVSQAQAMRTRKDVPRPSREKQF